MKPNTLPNTSQPNEHEVGSTRRSRLQRDEVTSLLLDTEGFYFTKNFEKNVKRVFFFWSPQVLRVIRSHNHKNATTDSGFVCHTNSSEVRTPARGMWRWTEQIHESKADTNALSAFPFIRGTRWGAGRTPCQRWICWKPQRAFRGTCFNTLRHLF